MEYKQIEFLDNVITHLHKRLGANVQTQNTIGVQFVDSVIVKLLDKIEILEATERKENEALFNSDYLDAVEHRSLAS